MIETFSYINADFPWFFATISFIFGAITGSFLNVCIYRIPAERSVVFPGSTCACGQAIAWYNNIPILSWFILRGRAPCCGERFSVRYPAIEMLTGVLFYVCWLMHPPVVAIIGFVFISFLICSTFIDFDHMIIPDRFSIGGMVLGVVLSFCFPALHGVEGQPIMENVESGVRSIVGALVGAGLVYWIAVLGEIVFRKPAMGEGDVKFVGFIGAFCGWQGAVFSMFGGAFIGSIVLLPLLLIGRIFGWKQTIGSDEGEDEEGEETVAFGSQVPFGPMLALGGLVYFLGFDYYVDWYFADFVANFFGQ
ncbi:MULTISPECIES: A24 family peptidase [unclassified Lentimonas]|uniref:prepilin peptidase n=1 Tax=unclassified Lentimonas TaxID=2630993 RepID=UPI0013299275|nr:MULTISPECIES: A24 family peptidase [unclassified Lentimonas]CAA6679251.1 Leader peptidase (Prepilin peptidase) (EC / N-methyltransferase (EC [Lentimonas sp. CC4]CAA6685916.1 Leader peptidase (Prepilin peptidase) (EC / N-methyltransferase (EC [Lentimonas sp. CC6]CAA7075994.1 Leader peptidase (Prepilin peptidase) (EC / N-methyltransferase (EC [Lentimonas sp. CC4]CAA7168576.1 Leader peptidase (Prepilin peptidase) (EC / N-methyltransferase (EC [Lentimonas sp. CC21]CAA7180967.1 Leader peptidase 